MEPSYQDTLLEVLYLLDAQGEVHNIYIDEVMEHSDGKQAERIIPLKIDELCQALDIPPTAWTDHYIAPESARNSTTNNLNQQYLNLLKIRGVSIGTFIYDYSQQILPIEDGEDGDGSACVTLRSPNGYDLMLLTDGEFWTEYEFEDPNEEVVKNSELAIKIRYEAHIVRSPAVVGQGSDQTN